MLPHIRAVVAAASFAFVRHQKVAGVYDHSSGRHLRIAAEAQGEHLQGFDGERTARFGGTLPELRDLGDNAQIHLTIEGDRVQGFDRSTSVHFTAQVDERLVQLYDHGRGEWFNFDIQVA